MTTVTPSDPATTVGPPTVPSPCVRCCTLDEQDVCLGCGRTLDDIRAWKSLPEAGKAECVARACQRLRDRGRPVPDGPLPAATETGTLPR